MTSLHQNFPQVVKRKNFKFVDPTDEFTRSNNHSFDDLAVLDVCNKNALSSPSPPPKPVVRCSGNNINCDDSTKTETSIDNCEYFFDHFGSTNSILTDFFDNRQKSELTRINEVSKTSSIQTKTDDLPSKSWINQKCSVIEPKASRSSTQEFDQNISKTAYRYSIRKADIDSRPEFQVKTNASPAKPSLTDSMEVLHNAASQGDVLAKWRLRRRLENKAALAGITVGRLQFPISSYNACQPSTLIDSHGMNYLKPTIQQVAPAFCDSTQETSSSNVSTCVKESNALKPLDKPKPVFREISVQCEDLQDKLAIKMSVSPIKPDMLKRIDKNSVTEGQVRSVAIQKGTTCATVTSTAIQTQKLATSVRCQASQSSCPASRTQKPQKPSSGLDTNPNMNNRSLLVTGMIKGAKFTNSNFSASSCLPISTPVYNPLRQGRHPENAVQYSEQQKEGEDNDTFNWASLVSTPRSSITSLTNTSINTPNPAELKSSKVFIDRNLLRESSKASDKTTSSEPNDSILQELKSARTICARKLKFVEQILMQKQSNKMDIVDSSIIVI